MTELQPLPEKPLVSIIVPSFDQGKFIRDTIQSCLDQDYRPIEIIVMDGASTDNTIEVLKSFGDIPELKWVSEPDEGVVDGVNKGLRKALGEIAAIQSSDDFYLTGSLSAVVETFQHNINAGLIYGDVKRVDANGLPIGTLHLPEFSIEQLLSRELTILQSAAFFRREAALALGGWNPEIPYVPDTDLWFRLAFHFPVVHCRRVLAACRTHPGQRDGNSRCIYSDYLKMLDLSKELKTASLKLKRAANAGAAMLKLRYGGPWTDSQLTSAVWKAVLFHPALLKSPNLPKHRLIPGYFALTRLKYRLGCWLYERWRMELVFRFPSLARRFGLEWQDLCNRNEIVIRQEDGIGRICQWKDSSWLTVPRVFPKIGKRLLNHVWPEAILPDTPVSLIVPVRGIERVEMVCFVVKSLLGSITPDSEVLICEHDEDEHYNLDWPPGIRHLFIPAEKDETFNKCHAMNEGARNAQHPILIFLDADIVLPSDCVFHILNKISDGWEAVRPIRFLFLLNEETSLAFMRDHDSKSIMEINQVHQNFPGGLTAIRRDVYFELGGHDERFSGWGAEDLEFLDRLQTRKLYPGEFLPAIHLWHPPAKKKQIGHRNADLLKTVFEESSSQRVQRCREALGDG